MMMTILGSLWTSILKPGVFLSGASGGVYALITGAAILRPSNVFARLDDGNEEGFLLSKCPFPSSIVFDNSHTSQTKCTLLII